MPEQQEITVLRSSLAEAALPRSPADRRKLIAETAFDNVISAIERGWWPLGEWERSCIAYGLACVRAGFYDAALNEARMVLTPPDRRSSAYLEPRAPSLEIEDIHRELEFTRGWPVRER